MTLEEKLKQAEEEWKNGRYSIAEKYAEDVYHEQSDDMLRAGAVRILGAIAITVGKNAKALEYFSEALTLAERKGNGAETALIVGNIGSAYLKMSDFPHALEYYQQALVLHQTLGNQKGMASISGNIGSVYLYEADYFLALEHYQKALVISQELGNKDLMATNLGNIGLIYQYLSEYPRAVEYYQQSLAINESAQNRQGWMANLGNIGNLYCDMKDYEKALEYLTKALNLSVELGLPHDIAASYGNIGIVLQALSDYSTAVEYFQKAVLLYTEVDNPIGVASNTANIGNVYEELLDYGHALEYYLRALDTMENYTQISGVASIVGNIGSIYANPNFEGYNPHTAEEFLLKALAINEEIGTISQNITVLQVLAELCEHQKRWEEFAEYYKKYHRLEKDIQSEEATKQAQLMEHRRRIEESERDRQLKIARHEVTVNLLHKTLPPSIAERLMSGENNIADKFESVSILFADIVGFTPLSTRIEPKKLVELLNNLFTRFDKLTEEYGAERVKTIGDAYMVVAGAPERCDDHALRMVKIALAMIEQTELFSREMGETIRIRIGINSGEAIGAIVGETKFSYDLWGDAVNTASRMESHGEAGKIHCTEEFKYAVEAVLTPSPLLHTPTLQFIRRGEMEIKGKGMMNTYFLEKR